MGSETVKAQPYGGKWIANGGASRDRKARHSENRQVIDLSRILQCPESLERLQCPTHCTFIVRRFNQSYESYEVGRRRQQIFFRIKIGFCAMPF